MDIQDLKPYLGNSCLPICLLFIGLFATLQSKGQSTADDTSILKGRVFDSIQNENCPNVVVALLTKDSVLVKFARTSKDGSFRMDSLVGGKYLLLCTHPGYDQYSIPVTIQPHQVNDLRTLALPPKTDLLAAVVVQPRSLTPRMKGDTLEYNTANIRMRVNASVEELLRRLPGVEVDKDGNITVNGQRVERLLVDGEDFFGGDPTIATRNLNADMIAKVQVLDKKSKEAEFTGVNDGQKTKTLNLSLKDDSKKGYFTNISAGSSFHRYYSTNGIIGSFKNKRQLAALAMSGNNGGNGFADNSGQSRAAFSMGGSINDPLGASAGNGIPRVTGGSMHYANRWNQNDGHLTGNYQYGTLSTQPASSLITIQALPGSIYAQRQQNSSINHADRHVLNAELQFNGDSLNTFDIIFKGLQAQGDNFLQATGSSSFNDTIVNTSMRRIHSDVRERNYTATVMWSIRSRHRKDRLFSITAGLNSVQNTVGGMLFSINKYYGADTSRNTVDSIDQRKTIDNSRFGINARVNLTQSLWRGGTMYVGYGYAFDRNKSFLETFGKSGLTYNNFIDSLSNRFQYTLFSQTFIVGVRGNIKKLRYAGGTNFFHFISSNEDMLKDTRLKYQYSSINPNLSLSYDMDAFRGMTLEYNGNSMPPTIAQLQPVKNNNDPLHIIEGNPNLHASFTHTAGLSFHKMGTTMINVGIKVERITNAFSTASYTDSLGRQVSQAVNVKGNGYASLYFIVSRKLKGLDLDVRMSPILTYNRNVGYVNQQLNNTTNYLAGSGFGISKFVQNKYNIQLELMALYHSSNSSVNSFEKVQYWTSMDNLTFSLFFLRGFEFNTTAYYSWRQNLSVLDDQTSVLTWNASINRNFFKNMLTVRCLVNDILGKGTGISQTLSGNTFSGATYKVVGRYWMLGASLRIVHKGK